MLSLDYENSAGSRDHVIDIVVVELNSIDSFPTIVSKPSELRRSELFSESSVGESSILIRDERVSDRWKEGRDCNSGDEPGNVAVGHERRHDYQHCRDEHVAAAPQED